MLDGVYVNWGRDELHQYDFYVENEQRLEYVIANLKRMGYDIYTIDKKQVSAIVFSEPELIDNFLK